MFVESFHAAFAQWRCEAAPRSARSLVLIDEEGGRNSAARRCQGALPADIAFSRGVTMTFMQRNYVGPGLRWVGTQSRVTGLPRDRPRQHHDVRP